MGFNTGEILAWWVLLFLVFFILLQLPFAVRLIADYGTTFNEVMTTVMVAGLVFIVLCSTS